jgi:hypothetical protein
MLHPREMVLPANLADGVRQMVAGGGQAGGQGGGDTHFHLHATAADGPAIERLFRSNGHVLADMMRGALRSNALTPRTI